MEKFTIGENKNESLCAEIIHHTEVFVKDSRRVLTTDFLSLDLINKMLSVISTNKDTLIKITPKNSDEDLQIKSALEDLNDLERDCHQRKTLQ